LEPPRLIATALPEELGALLRRTRDLRPRDGAFDGSLGGRPVRLACTGSGPRRAARELDRLLAGGPVSLVIGAGIAGALTAPPSPGDVVVGRRVRDENGEAPASDATWRDRALRQGALSAVTVTVDRIVTRPAERLALARGLPSESLASVDTESAAWARAAERRRAPCLILRAISDGASEALPDYLAECLDAEGGLSRKRVAARALTHPRSLPSLLRLRRQAREAAEGLSRFLEKLLREEGP
jgi:adenosylhomocysteine nucleosidase